MNTYSLTVTVLLAAAASLLAIENSKRKPVRCATRNVEAGNAEGWANGERREVDVSGLTGQKDDKILVHKINEKFYATSAKCSHFSVPLKFGLHTATKLPEAVCPAHDAAFSLETGEAIRGPVKKPIDTYPVEVNSDGRVIVKLYPKEAKQPVKRSPKNQSRILIIGAGAAGYSAAETLRLEGFDGEIVMMTKEDVKAPIDRTRLSKALGKAPELREESYFKDTLDITLQPSCEVMKVDTEKKVVNYLPVNRRNSDKSLEGEIKYDKLLIACGAKPRKLFCPGSKLKNVFTMRTQKDNDAIVAACTKNQKVVIVGGGFIGLEMACMLKQKGCEVKILDMLDLPLERIFGKRVGAGIAKFLHKNGVPFLGGTGVQYVKGQHIVNGVETDQGDVLPADAVIVATGVQMDAPDMTPLSSCVKGRDGSLLVDPFLKVRGCNSGDIYAAGDICTFPDFRSGRDLRIEHWNTAMEQGKTAALNMLNQYQPFTTVPYFWTELFGKKIKFVGSIDTHQHSVVEGDMDEMKCIVYYVNPRDEITGVLTIENPKVSCAVSILMRLGKMPKASEVLVGACNSADLIARAEKLGRGEVLKTSAFDTARTVPERRKGGA